MDFKTASPQSASCSAALLLKKMFLVNWLKRERQIMDPLVDMQNRKKPRMSVSKRDGLQVFIVGTDTKRSVPYLACSFLADG